VLNSLGNITITDLEIIRYHVFYLKHDGSETGFYLRLPAEFKSVSRDRDELFLLGPSGTFLF
jgi:hypothetical protein